MSRTLINLWRMFQLEFQKVGWDIIGTTYLAAFIILLDARISGTAYLAVYLSTWIALRLYFPFRARRRAEYEACLPVSWVCVTSARFCVLMVACALVLVLPAILVEDMRGYRMIGWLAARLPEGNAVERLWRQFSRGGAPENPWEWLCSHASIILFVPFAVATVLHVPRWWKAVAIVLLITAACALVWHQYVACRYELYNRYGYSFDPFNGRFQNDLFDGYAWRALFELASYALYWPVNIACAAVLLLVKTTPFSKRGGVR